MQTGRCGIHTWHNGWRDDVNGGQGRNNYGMIGMRARLAVLDTLASRFAWLSDTRLGAGWRVNSWCDFSNIPGGANICFLISYCKPGYSRRIFPSNPGQL